MATVYLAEDLKRHRKVTVKVLRPELAAVLGADRFVHEITKTANLNHAHILRRTAVRNRSPGRQMGFIAQEAVKVIPEVVSGEDGHYAMQYGPITALLVEAIKEQQGIIEDLKVRIETLEAANRLR